MNYEFSLGVLITYGVTSDLFEIHDDNSDHSDSTLVFVQNFTSASDGHYHSMKTNRTVQEYSEYWSIIEPLETLDDLPWIRWVEKCY
ncbi:hypothetical protein R5R35_008891 [Gryllus longicercus]|uniref:Uncharacterized protein n=1 Tax=Gryllus longicercus TaxID=2509291 RepID=A0AAN9YXM8_9ORTH